jgi:hypothetical protein
MPAATGPGTTVLNLLWLNDVKIPTRGGFWKLNDLQYYSIRFSQPCGMCAVCIGNQSMLWLSCWLSWEQVDLLMDNNV